MQTPPPMMHAVLIRRFGGPEVVEYADVPTPVPRAGELLLKVEAASLNPVDWKIRAGKFPVVRDDKLPYVLGRDFSATVVQSDDTALPPGTLVHGMLDIAHGSFAQYAVARPEELAPVPGALDRFAAAAVPLAALTAWQGLFDHGGLRAGQRVLIHAGAGGVGAHAIQIAKILGLHVTTTTSGRNADFCRELGADAIVDYTKTEPLPTELDAVFDTLGTTEQASIAACKRGGIVVGIGGMPDAEFARERLPWFARPAVAIATLGRTRAAAKAGVRYRYLFMRPDGKELAELAAWIDAGTLKPLIHRSYPFAEFREAFAELERGRARGKIVVTI